MFKNRKDYHEFYFDHVSIVHAFAAFTMCSFIMINYGFMFSEPNNPLHTIAVVHSLGYFIFDTVFEVYYSTLDYLMVAHHASCLIPLTYMLFNNYGGPENAAAFVIAECSNPFIQIRNLYNLAEWERSAVYKINEVIFAVSFIFTRGVIGPIFQYYMYVGVKTPRIVKYMTSALIFISYMWIFKIVNVLWKRIRETFDAKPPAWWVDGDVWLKKHSRKGPFKQVATAVLFAVIVVFPVIWEIRQVRS